MTLAKFLLDRVRDREALVLQATETLGPDHKDVVFARRECESMRRIVERLHPLVGQLLPSSELAIGILIDLAQPHQEHPDFQTEWWRP